ncbi:hypothetical protein [Streptomyces sp.]|nr:hypothetical protein [Streptomyces sp.]
MAGTLAVMTGGIGDSLGTVTRALLLGLAAALTAALDLAGR